MPARIPPPVLKEFKKYLAEGYDLKSAASAVGISYKSAQTYAKRMYPQGVPAKLSSTQPAYAGNHPANTPETLQRPLETSELDPIARDCLYDFARFRYRYMGRISSPWQENAADMVRERLATGLKEYGVVNCPPGGGKTTLFTHDIPAWLTCRSRSIRGFQGAHTQAIANSYTGNLRDTFQRKIPIQAKSEDLALNLAVDAQATLAKDYGNFNPNIPQPIGAPWTRGQFTVAQHGSTLTGEKEATWTAFGRDTGFLGWRVNFVVWDDLVRSDRLRNIDTIENDRRWYVNEAITRLEPGGLFIIQGQRLGAEDLYRFSLDMPSGYDDLTDEEILELGNEITPSGRKFFHVVYKAHYEEFCIADKNPHTHSIKALPYDPVNPRPGRCLLDPVRISWRELKSVQAQPLSNYQVVYQQEDSDPSEVLVPKHWIDGGTFDNEIFIGCWDDDRGPADIPQNLSGTTLSVVTVDPSPSKFWAIQWWLYNEPSQQSAIYDMITDADGKRRRVRVYPGERYLLDQIFSPMGANDLLDWNVNTSTWTGLLVSWFERSARLGRPFKYLIIEANAAQKFMMQYQWFTQWANTNSIIIKPHTTTLTKLDPEYGVKTIRNHYRFGRVRLPGTPEGRRVALPLVSQVTRYPDAQYDDCVMAHWFLEYQLQFIIKTASNRISVYKDIPSWVRQPLKVAQ